LLARDGKIVNFQNYGYRDVERQLPMERDTICRAYSMSKIITCVATLILVEDGRLNLDDPVAKYLPELKDGKVWTGGTASGRAHCPHRLVLARGHHDIHFAELDAHNLAGA
jgi:CubicO group peptidase (beta-lactamase class C family)